ncbi:MAG TPA: hypothetical protein VJ987_10710, partial [Anaerolineales bacterium]|nr:hypothetical protein [Anaerolineales bacterium]
EEFFSYGHEFVPRRDRQMYNKKSTQNGSFFCCFAPKHLKTIGPLLVTRREPQEQGSFIEPAIQMLLVP